MLQIMNQLVDIQEQMKNVTDIVRKVNSLFFYARVDYDIMMLEGVEEVKYPVETITDKKLLEPHTD